MRLGRSRLYLKDALVADNEGLHGMVERCGSRRLEAGTHQIYLEGFQCGGGVGQELTYSGPDTGGSKVFMRSGAAYTASATAPKYAAQCNPANLAAGSQEFTLCMFRSEVGLSATPKVGLADTGLNRLYYVGQAQIPQVNFRDLGTLRSYVALTPDANYVWAIYGRLKIATEGSYTLCITSDDGCAALSRGERSEESER